MNLALFFEGTWQGVRGKRTNVSLVYEACLEDDAQRRHLEAGPGAHIGALVLGKTSGVGWRMIFARARRRPARPPRQLPRPPRRPSSPRSQGPCGPPATASFDFLSSAGIIPFRLRRSFLSRSAPCAPAPEDSAYCTKKPRQMAMYGSPQSEQTAPSCTGAPQFGQRFSRTSPQKAQNVPPTGSAFARSGRRYARPSTS